MAKRVPHQGEVAQVATLEGELFAAESAALAQARLFWLKAAVARWLDAESGRP